MCLCVGRADLEAEDIVGSKSRWDQLPSAVADSAFTVFKTAQSGFEAFGVEKGAQAAGFGAGALSVVYLSKAAYSTIATAGKLGDAICDHGLCSLATLSGVGDLLHDGAETVNLTNEAANFAKSIGVISSVPSALSKAGTACDFFVSGYEGAKNIYEISKGVPDDYSQDRKKMITAHKWKNAWELTKNIISIAIGIIAIFAIAYSAILIFVLSVVYLACVLAAKFKSMDVQHIAVQNGIRALNA